ncbi:MAG: endonuclease/exonuclease/phosphatase family protein, partial [Cyanobacteria bacterium Co-bin8]|nr:endonuclease/exonuclease/phosphatase family protein [Cyanobacteria bacterium Co-bin8]
MLRILTMNLNYYGTQHGPWAVRRQIITDAIRQTQPDIMAFQAVAQNPAAEDCLDQAAQLARELEGYDFSLFCPTRTYADGNAEGMALLSRLPMAASHYRELSLRPGLEDTSPRILVHARFDLADGPLHLFNAHFSWVAKQTQDNLDEVLPYVQSLPGRAVLVGDLNTPPDSPLMAQIQAEGWVDSWANQHPQTPGYTFVEGGQLSKRIDYVWVRETLRSHIKDIEVIANSPAEDGSR